MAECHPVGFQWVMEAKARGATLIHVDPRFTRTSAVADVHVPLRAGTDIAFLGGIINHVLPNEQDFREYVLAYTNAATIIGEDFRDTEDLDGVFSGCDAEDRTLRRDDLAVRGRRRSRPRPASATRSRPSGRASALGTRRRRRTASRTAPAARASASEIRHRRDACSTPAASSRSSSGTSPATPRRWSSGRAGCRRSSSCGCARCWSATPAATAPPRFVYSVGWTHHTVGVQYIRAASILQTLLGNIGRPGGGILALRGHASIQGSHRHPDAVQHPARLHPDAARRVRRTTSTTSSRTRRRTRASGPSCAPTW